MTKRNSNLIKYLSIPLLAGGIVLGASNISKAQVHSQEESVRLAQGVKAGVATDIEKDYTLWKFNFDSFLKETLDASDKSKIYLDGKHLPGTFIRFGPGKDYAELHAQKGEGIVTIAIKDGRGSTNICAPNSTGSKNNPIVSYAFDPNTFYLEKWENPTASVLDSLILKNVGYIRYKVNQIGEKVEGLEGKVAGIDSVVNLNSKKLDSTNVKLDYLTEQEKNRIKEEPTESGRQKRLNFIASGVAGGPRYFEGQIQYNAVNNSGWSLGPFVSFSLGKTETDVVEEIRFREKTTMGSNTLKERTDVYQIETSKNYVGSLGIRASKNLSGGLYGFLEAGWNVLKNKIKEFGTAYIDYTRDGVKIKPTNSAPISGSFPDKNNYKFLPMVSLGFGENLTDNLSLEGKVNHEFNDGGKTSGSLGVRLGF